MPAVPTAKTAAEPLLVGLNIYLTMGEHTSIAYTDLKINRKYRNSEAIISLIQTLQPQLAMDANLESTNELLN